jgi:hypothetical protein
MVFPPLITLFSAVHIFNFATNICARLTQTDLHVVLLCLISKYFTFAFIPLQMEICLNHQLDKQHTLLSTNCKATILMHGQTRPMKCLVY